jgi:hypothetical protein
MTKKQFKILITILTIVAFMIPALLVIADDDDDVGIIITVAGTGEVPTSDDVGDGGPATEAQLSLPHGVVLDESGNLYIAEIVLPPPMLCPLPCITFDVSHRVRKVDADGIITTVVGTGEPPPPPGPDVDIGDGGPATEAQLNRPADLVFDKSGNLYIAEHNGYRVRKVDTHGIITTVVGTGVAGSSGDGGPATEAQLNEPHGLALDESGNLYIAEKEGHRVRKVDAHGIITTVAGTGVAGSSGDGGPATEAQLWNAQDMVFDESGNLYITEFFGHRVRKVDADGIITTVVGTGVAGSSGDGGPATEAQLDSPAGMVFDESGNLYISEFSGHRIRKVDAHGIITTVAGTGVDGFSGDGGPATSAQFNSPDLMTLDEDNLYITDFFNHRIRLVSIDDDDDCEGKGRKWNC